MREVYSTPASFADSHALRAVILGRVRHEQSNRP